MQDVDLVVVDDDISILKPIARFCEKKNVNCKTFSSTKPLMGYLERIGGIPKSYWVDMRIVGDLEGPERLYRFLESSGKLTNFTFMTGHLSDHDKGVIQRTGGRYVLKPVSLCDLIDSLKTQEPYL